MNTEELNFMNEGTEARYNSTFNTWPQEDIERYWKVVDKFNQTFNPTSYSPETSQI